MEIKILGEKYTVKEVDLIDYDAGTFGQIDHIKNVIEIKKDIPAEKKKVTLLHEILHAIFQQLGFDEEHDDEHLIKSLSASLIQVFTENKLF